MNLKEKTPMARAEYYLLEMREGRFQDETGTVIYPNQFEKEVDTFEFGRDVALMILDTKDEELRAFDLLFLLQGVNNEMERMRRALKENRLHDAYLSFHVVEEFVESGLFGLSVAESLSLVDLSESDYKQMAESFDFVRRALARKQKSAFNGAR